ncbi:MAG: hypothetical protein Q8P67_28230 [archaeon]|nr:hypothetical protein [archaeon]
MVGSGVSSFSESAPADGDLTMGDSEELLDGPSAALPCIPQYASSSDVLPTPVSPTTTTLAR